MHRQSLEQHKHSGYVSVACSMLLVAGGIALPGWAATGYEHGQVEINLRYRLEHVQQSNELADALASTLRTRVTASSQSWHNWSALVEVDHVETLGNDLYNSSYNGRTDYSVVADPRGTEVNQAALRYRHEGTGTTFTVGRQRVNLLNQRFVGGVGWRQNEQTFDGYRLQQQLGETVQLDVSRLHNVNRIFGPYGPQAQEKSELYNAVLQWQFLPNQSMKLFTHDFSFADWAARDSRTYGVDYQGQVDWGYPLQWQLVHARQEDTHQAPSAYRHHYQQLELATEIADVQLTGGYERLAGDGESALQTPLATLHAFQGYTDQFLVTPAEGIRDFYLTAGYQWRKVRVTAGWHRLYRDTDRLAYGSEYNLVATMPLTDRIGALLKAASFQADRQFVNTHKLHLMLTMQL